MKRRRRRRGGRRKQRHLPGEDAPEEVQGEVRVQGEAGGQGVELRQPYRLWPMGLLLAKGSEERGGKLWRRGGGRHGERKRG
uniref:Uncharacterized protein n=1 Tax=Chromera velia CCMP2878 TaxID=1169474 RepID=A0A0G4IDA9_9ALVE|eukprot:Cvel_13334.t1-p1 / transcript=Cvel_13334.t1 / gene=Cvel_13334 / organism=Chromera_velia_CCMP2878 / gene_product=hypothetical protein / transcript_product=hypothetical protein / location=Cvel_scaffold905:59642-59884(+) / protein_length=81 / sequence_SO=supercontig / SO=protein_coding / is_pseudo=false